MSEADVAQTGLAHQFEDLSQQQEADALGIWIFLVTEILFFGGLFGSYAIYRWLYLPGFQAGSHLLDVRLGAVNTAVLLGSSLTMALAVRAAQLAQRKALTIFLAATIALGCVFLFIKGVEYHDKFVEHIVPGLDFAPVGEVLAHLLPGGIQHAQMFFCFYFSMTLLHALHMIVGVGLLLTLIVRARRNEFHSQYFAPVEVVGLYWHFVDIIWIFLFPLLYLIGGR